MLSNNGRKSKTRITLLQADNQQNRKKIYIKKSREETDNNQKNINKHKGAL